MNEKPANNSDNIYIYISDEAKSDSHLIHYCWFGRGEKPEILTKCIDSWNRYMPDYKIVEWNEDNFDIGINEFSRTAYETGNYAFVSDVARLWAVYEYGGIYLDIDVELKDSWDYLEQYDSFFFFESDQNISSGLGFGARKKDKLIGKMLSDYSAMKFEAKHRNQYLSPGVNTASVKEYFRDFRRDDSLQIIDQHIFLPCSEYAKKAEDHSAFTWATESQIRALKYAKKKRTHWKFRQKLRSEKVKNFFEAHFPKPIVKLYLFVAYDFIDYGLVYWIYKAISKVKSKFSAKRDD